MAFAAKVATFSLTALLLFSACSPVVSDIAQTTEDGSCLLAKKKVVGKLDTLHGKGMDVAAKSHRGWRTQHAQLHTNLNASANSLEAFIEAQTASEDACSSRLAEAKRALDGVLNEINKLSAQVEAHEEVLTTETENLEISKEAIEAVEKAYQDDVAKCEAQREEAKSDLARYEAEREELRQIANPEVRYDFVTPETPAPPSLTQTWSKDSCQTFKGFLKKHPHKKQKVLSLKQGPNETLAENSPEQELSCDEQREKLQEVFTETWDLVDDLLEDATKNFEDESCFEAAEAKKTAGLVPQVAAREEAAGRIETSEAALAQLEPVLNRVKEQAEELQNHISATLTPECAEVSQLSETLKDVRELILSLERCPGRNDFVLQIPAESVELPENQQGFFLVREDGLCGKQAGMLSVDAADPAECAALCAEAGATSFAFGKVHAAGHCLASDLEVTPELAKQFKENLANPMCPSGSDFSASILYDFYALEPIGR